MVADGSLINFSPVELGSGSYRVFFRDRCSDTSLLCEADVTSGSFNRILNDISSATVDIAIRSDSEECCGCLAQLAPWQHELAIYRDGLEVWCGPIQRIELDFAEGVGTVSALDLLAWADKRTIELSGEDYDVEDVDLKDVFEWVLWHGYCKDPWCMTWVLNPVGIPITRSYPSYNRYSTSSTTLLEMSGGPQTLTLPIKLPYTAGQIITITYDTTNSMTGTVTSYDSTTGIMVVEVSGVTGAGSYAAWDVALQDEPKWGGTYAVCGDELRDLADAGLDYTVVKRHMWGGDIEISAPTPIASLLLDHHFVQTPKVIIAGEGMATRLIYGAGGSGYSGWADDQMWIEPPFPYGPIDDNLNGNQQQYGLLEVVRKKDKFDDVDTSVVPNALTQAAFGEFELSHEPFVYIEGGVLSPKAPLDFESLIPGMRYDVRLAQTCRIVFGNYRLHEVNVSFDSSKEDVSIKLAPIGVDSTRSA